LEPAFAEERLRLVPLEAVHVGPSLAPELAGETEMSEVVIEGAVLHHHDDDVLVASELGGALRERRLDLGLAAPGADLGAVHADVGFLLGRASCDRESRYSEEPKRLAPRHRHASTSIDPHVVQSEYP